MRRRVHLPHLAELAKVPKWVRPFHRHARRHTIALGLGTGIMSFGSLIAHGHIMIFLPHFAADVIGYGIHGIGLIPWVMHAEPMFRVLLAEGK